ncbi:hypothetical protein [Bradyrhizobium pachyrhizi]|uniref:hypothetical protein n=1 Tax=Bradyrhizobium pachyrhizi TaxID=280333 RepID=UPI00128F08F6|nr:hypothetical protein [Bradyrhizobium pachyrhizi]
MSLRHLAEAPINPPLTMAAGKLDAIGYRIGKHFRLGSGIRRQGAKPVGLIYTIVVLSQLPFYGFIIGFAWAASVAARNGRRGRALVLAVVAALPLVSYLYAYVEARVMAPPARQAEVASWPRISITRENRPRVFLTTWGIDGYVPKTMVALGLFEKAYGVIGDDWYSVERVNSAACVDAGKDERAIRNRNPNEPNPCMRLTKIERRDTLRLNAPQIAEPHLRLLADRDAPSHREIDRTAFASSTLELRLVSQQGSELVSFWEAPYFRVPSIPPLLGRAGWSRGWFVGEHTPRPDIAQFVRDALHGN